MEGSAGRRKVYCHVTFLKIGEINTLKENFEAEVLIRASWPEPELDNSSVEPSDIEWEDFWNPKLYIHNFVTEPKVTVTRTVERDKSGTAYVVERRRVKGSFMEQLELQEFPFDVQDLSIILNSSLSTSEVELENHPHEVHKIYKQSFIEDQEWHLYKYVTADIYEDVRDKADPSVRCVTLRATCRAARRPSFYLSNNISVTLVITILAFTTFAVDPKLTQNRLQLAFTMVLTCVAFKFVVLQSLPRVSYMTYLDNYIMATMVVLTIICIWHAILNIVPWGRRRDYIALIVIAAIYVLYNLYFFLRILLVPYKKRREMSRLEVKYTKTAKAQALRRDQLGDPVNIQQAEANVIVYENSRNTKL